MIMEPLLTIRADATPDIGTGHLMRTLALAHAWREQAGDVIFVSCCRSRGLHGRMAAVARKVVDLDQVHPDPGDWKKTARVIGAEPAAWVVVDGYHFDGGYHKNIRALGKRLLVIDDMAHLDHYEADIVLNQNIDAAGRTYATAAFTRLLLGTRYILLRPEFVARTPRQGSITGPARRLLVTLGGADSDNVTLTVMRALETINSNALEALIVVGSANPHHRQIRDAAGRSRLPMRVVENAPDMAELMAWADVAVSAGGSTCWELAYMGVPTLAITMAENQLAVVEGLARTGAIVKLGWHHDLSAAELAQAIQDLVSDVAARTRMQGCGRTLVDGMGAKRVIKEMMAA
jgi:UDP-2,4-diacetamido-2,4,6-trideoxy-beta-L-altropyranose hydrolase